MLPILQKALTQNNLNLDAQTQTDLIDYLALLDKWNAVFNLTAIRDPEDMVYLHLLDSLVINPYLKGNRIIDIGTGAGLPGIPLSMLNPTKQFYLLDSNSKKTRFLTQAKSELKLTNVEVIHSRCEDFQQAPGFDTIVSRAFSTIAVMLSTTAHMLAPGGQFLAMKGMYPEAELKDIPSEFIVSGVHKLAIKGLAAERHVVCIERK